MIKIFYTYNMEESEAFIKNALKISCGKEFEIKYTKNGKPYVDYPIYFSLTHTGSLLACAVSDRAVGVDAEKVRYFKNKDAISKKFFGSSKNLDNASFIKKWTEFESKIKYYGETIFNCPNARKGKLITKHIILEDYVISVSSDITDEIEMELI